METNNNVDAMLISLVSQYQCVWDKNHFQFKDKIAKENAWLSMASTIFGSHLPGIKGVSDGLKRRWLVLRNRYWVEKRKVLRGMSSGAAGSEKVWKHMLELSFIEKGFSLRQTTGNNMTRRSQIAIQPARSSPSGSDGVGSSCSNFEAPEFEMVSIKMPEPIEAATDTFESSVIETPSIDVSSGIHSTNTSTRANGSIKEADRKIKRSKSAKEASASVSNALSGLAYVISRPEEAKNANFIFGTFIATSLDKLTKRDASILRLKIHKLLTEYDV